MQATTIQAWDLEYTGSARWYLRLLPSLTDFAFLLPAFLLFVIMPGAKSLLDDGDTGWHLRTGDWILQHGAVPTTDFFSFTKSGQPWFAWEWGWDLLFGFIHRSWGLAGVAFLNVLLLCFISALLFRLIRRCSENDILAFVLTVIAMNGSAIHWLARPHLFSWLFVLIFAHLILTAEQGKRAVLVYLPPLMLLWTNIHGAFFVGILMLLASAAGAGIYVLAITKYAWSRAYHNARPYLFCASACMLVTFVNPYTWHLHAHIYRYLLDSNLLDNIQEYQSVSFHHGPVIYFECMLLLGAASVAWCVKAARISGAILMLVWAHLALVSGRNIPIFLLIAAPWVACMLQDALSRVTSLPSFSNLGAIISEVWNDFRPLERSARVHAVSAAAVLILAASFASGQPRFEAQFDSRRFPLKAISLIHAAKPSRIFTYDQWGDYLIYRFYPAQRVFMDGRSDFYGAELIAVYQHLIEARYDCESDLRRFGIDLVVIKPDAPLATLLKQLPDWKLLFDDGHVVVFKAATARPVRETVPLSSVVDGENRLETSPGFKADRSKFEVKTQERRSSWLLRL